MFRSLRRKVCLWFHVFQATRMWIRTIKDFGAQMDQADDEKRQAMRKWYDIFKRNLGHCVLLLVGALPIEVADDGFDPTLCE